MDQLGLGMGKDRDSLDRAGQDFDEHGHILENTIHNLDSIEDTDPITLEPLSKLEVPPFGLRVEDGSHTHLFDGRVLAMYLVSSGQFLNPLTNVPLERADCERLDGHLRDNRLGKPCVAVCMARGIARCLDEASSYEIGCRTTCLGSRIQHSIQYSIHS